MARGSKFSGMPMMLESCLIYNVVIGVSGHYATYVFLSWMLIFAEISHLAIRQQPTDYIARLLPRSFQTVHCKISVTSH